MEYSPHDQDSGEEQQIELEDQECRRSDGCSIPKPSSAK